MRYNDLVRRWSSYLLLLCIATFSQQCRESTKPVKESQPSEVDTSTIVKPVTKPAAVPPEPLVTFSLIPLDSAHRAWLDEIHSPDTIDVLLALNRVDIEHLFRQDTLVVPSVYKDPVVYSPFPDTLPLLDSVRKILLCSYRLQAFAVYENGKRIRWGPCSLGKKQSLTPNGLLHTNWKSRHTTSTVNGEWNLFWYFNLESHEGVSMHQYDLPGYPASHACVRLEVDDARWLYDWADQWLLADARHIAAPGTPVVVFGSYPFGKSRPWRRLDERKIIPKHSVDELTKEITPFLDEIMNGQVKRDSVLFARGKPLS